MPDKKKKEKKEESQSHGVAVEHKHEKEKELAPCPKRIRINFSGGNAFRSFSPGQVLRVPEDIPEESARSWLASGAAEIDKSGKGPSETK